MFQKQLPLFLLLLFFTSAPFFSAAAEASIVQGKLTAQGKGVAGARLLAWPVSAPSLDGEAPFRSETTGKEGTYSLEVPPGEYYLLAEGNDLFAFYGRNPVMVPPEGLEGVSISLLPRKLPAPEKETRATTGMLGRVTVGGKPLQGAVVYVYPDLTSRLRGMGLGMAQSDAEGIFEAEMPPGTYYLLVRYRKSQELAGPLRSGDFIGYYAANPLKVVEGQLARIAIPMLEVPEKVDRLGGTLFGQTSLQGRIVDGKGAPVAGARAVIYDEPTMLNRPLYVSQPTGEDGRYVLSLPQGGAYYLAARDTLGGAPAPGDLYGTYDKTPDHSLQVKTGQDLEGIDIVVEKTF